MCCFTKPVKSVSNTKIFARASENSEQFVVYSMSIKTTEDLAMVLPLPVKIGSGEHALKFISLKEYPNFFADLASGFPTPITRPEIHGLPTASVASRSMPLEVVQVGNFEASFVPTENDFSRLDERFRLPPGTWEKLPAYSDYGFAVFKLKQGTSQIHPMAFSFPRRDARALFFPTVHIHDGEVHKKAEFDHILYCQIREGEPMYPADAMSWVESAKHARSFMNVTKATVLIAPDDHCYKTELKGDLWNRDTFIQLES